MKLVSLRLWRVNFKQYKFFFFFDQNVRTCKLARDKEKHEMWTKVE